MFRAETWNARRGLPPPQDASVCVPTARCSVSTKCEKSRAAATNRYRRRRRISYPDRKTQQERYNKRANLCYFGAQTNEDGAWLSSVEHSAGGRGVAGSNPAAPRNKIARNKTARNKPLSRATLKKLSRRRQKLGRAKRVRISCPAFLAPHFLPRISCPAFLAPHFLPRIPCPAFLALCRLIVGKNFAKQEQSCYLRTL